MIAYPMGSFFSKWMWKYKQIYDNLLEVPKHGQKQKLNSQISSNDANYTSNFVFDWLVLIIRKFFGRKLLQFLLQLNFSQQEYNYSPRAFETSGNYKFISLTGIRSIPCENPQTSWILTNCRKFDKPKMSRNRLSVPTGITTILISEPFHYKLIMCWNVPKLFFWRRHLHP